MSEKPYLDCVHCGLCLPSCPTYRVLGNEMDSPRGRIYLMRAYDEGRTTITDSFVEHMFRCLDCRACETAWMARSVLWENCRPGIAVLHIARSP